ncbi:hypothetical protein TWF569_002426 [Orbilia oligospora]|uniref:Uncharacterized protein n=1 Tax=Orbilia oligospora TaxID=2813651 RepID=A0A7C8NVH0_ORBOL|nr:hypothetical protein TWF102_008223 [Orbilia oligospora]KAF3114488.1 hypothetical protein TWF706_008403 [Orbilia oligospora]KAF3114740.1 hypothetical protein TWF103_000478 [Orbilia oligospora]KAF3122005.1 hypothetical protein TWF569_002426 [Orbilia oligospora]
MSTGLTNGNPRKNGKKLGPFHGIPKVFFGSVISAHVLPSNAVARSQSLTCTAKLQLEGMLCMGKGGVP